MQLDIDKICESLTALGGSAWGGDPGAEGDNISGTPARTAISQDLSKIKSRDGNQSQSGVQRLTSKAILRTSQEVTSAD